MVAPIDARASFEVEGETITLRLNFRSLALAEKEGIDALRLNNLSTLQSVVLLRCLAVQEHPEMDDEQAFAIVTRATDPAITAIKRLFAEFGGKASAGGNAPKKRATAKA